MKKRLDFYICAVLGFTILFTRKRLLDALTKIPTTTELTITKISKINKNSGDLQGFFSKKAILLFFISPINHEKLLIFISTLMVNKPILESHIKASFSNILKTKIIFVLYMLSDIPTSIELDDMIDIQVNKKVANYTAIFFCE